jgi:hypothetical protein
MWYATEASQPQLSVFAAVRCAEVVDVIGDLERMGSVNDVIPPIVAHIAAGSIYSHVAPANDGISARQIAGALGARFPHANIMVRDGRSDFPGRTPYIEGRRSSGVLRSAIKECLDPERLLNPWMREW